MSVNINVSSSLRKRFVKDWALPITILKDPYFKYFIKLYEPLFQSQTIYNELLDLIDDLGGEEKFFNASKSIMESIIHDIKDTEEFKKFNEGDLSDYNVKPEIPLGDIYRSDNNDKLFVSVDIKKANFQALRWVNPKIVLGQPDYEHLIEAYTDLSYYIGSKHIRQVIFGNINPKRQRKVIRYLTHNRIIPRLQEFLSLEPKGLAEFTTASDDEVVLRINKDIRGEGEQYIEFIRQYLSNLNIDLNINMFVLRQLGERSYFIKEYINGEIEFKAVPSHYFAECYKYYLGEKLSDYDSMSYYDGRVVKFIDRLFDEG